MGFFYDRESDTFKGGRIGAGVAAAVLLVTTLIVFAVGVSLNRVQANEWGCLYGGGAFESKGLKELIAPGHSGGPTLFDRLVTIPADDRIYAIDNDPTTADFGGQPIIVPAKGSDAENNGIVTVVVPVQARFTINENACSLYQNYLKGKGPDLDWNGTRTKDGHPDPGVWPKFLNLQMNQVLTTSIRSQLAGKSYVELYTNFSNYPTIQANVSKALGDALRSSLGGDFFCGPSYQFDGKADGNVDNCPPIEIVIKEIKPENPIFLQNLQTIVANQEQQRVIASDKDKAIAQQNADKATSLNKTEVDKQKQLAATEAQKETQLAQTEADKQVALAKALADAEVARKFADVVQAQTANSLVQKQVETAFCERLAAVGVDCAEYFKAVNWRPITILGGATTPLVNVPANAQ
jgi:hypothetical protein